MMGVRPLYRRRLKIYVRIIRRDFWVAMFGKYIPEILGREQKNAIWRAARNPQDCDGYCFPVKGRILMEMDSELVGA